MRSEICDVYGEVVGCSRGPVPRESLNLSLSRFWTSFRFLLDLEDVGRSCEMRPDVDERRG